MAGELITALSNLLSSPPVQVLPAPVGASVRGAGALAGTYPGARAGTAAQASILFAQALGPTAQQLQLPPKGGYLQAWTAYEDRRYSCYRRPCYRRPCYRRPRQLTITLRTKQHTHCLGVSRRTTGKDHQCHAQWAATS